jgi:crotonobetainyl-CoA:carnitine CoA-transferase CaiB-like acyl-CoA transferase
MAVDHDGHRSLGIPVKLSANPGRPGNRPPLFGEHADAILAELGYSRTQADVLRAEGMVLAGSGRSSGDPR